MEHFDAVIVGAGPAGLSAALVLGGGRRKVLLLDGGPSRNVRATAAHGVFTRDCTPPGDLKRLGLWDDVMVMDLKHFDGSLRPIDRVPPDVKAAARAAAGRPFRRYRHRPCGARNTRRDPRPSFGRQPESAACLRR